MKRPARSAIASPGAALLAAGGILLLSLTTVLATNSPRPAWTQRATVAGAEFVVSHWTNLNPGHSWILQVAPTPGEWRTVSQHWGEAVTVIRAIEPGAEFWRLTAGP